MLSASESFDLALEFDVACAAIDIGLTGIARTRIDDEAYLRPDGARAHWWLAVAVLPFRAWVAHTIHIRARATAQGTRVMVHVIGAYGPAHLDYGGNRSLIKRLKKSLIEPTP